MVDAVDAPAETQQALMPPAGLGLILDPDGGDATLPQREHERILSCLPLVDSIARRIYGTLPPNTCLELPDLAQSGLLGLVSAGRCYDPGTTVPFSLYARYRIEGEILDSLRRQDLAPRRLRRWQKEVSAARREMAAVLQREPSEEELCERLMVSLAELRDRNLVLSRTGTRTPAKQEDGRPSDPANRPDTDPDQICSQHQLREVLDRVIDGLSARHQQVIRLHYCRYMTMREIGGEMGVNESRVSQMHRSALQAMGRTLRDWGICSPAQI
jgi:RNA polymerase sigma factor for flagellar operon FliA